MKNEIIIVNDHNGDIIAIPQLSYIPNIGENIAVTNDNCTIEGIVTKVTHSIEDYYDIGDRRHVDQTVEIRVW